MEDARINVLLNEEKYDEWNEDYKIYEECKETTNG